LSRDDVKRLANEGNKNAQRLLARGNELFDRIEKGYFDDLPALMDPWAYPGVRGNLKLNSPPHVRSRETSKAMDAGHYDPTGEPP